MEKVFVFREQVKVAVKNLNVQNFPLHGRRREFFGMSGSQSTADFSFRDFNISQDYNFMFSGNEYITYESEHTLKFHMSRKYQVFLFTLLLPNAILTVLR